MPSLLELQSAFGAALAGGVSDASGSARGMERATGAAAAGNGIEAHVVANGLEPQARLRIYRNNSHETFASALRAAFPVIERLVGAQYFGQLVHAYRERFPSTSGNLHHIGERFAGFLAQTFDTTPYAYFADVARLEWALQEATTAADHGALDLARLALVPQHDYPRLIFRLHPAARLVSSAFPVLTIWKANQCDAGEHPQIDLDSGAEHVLLARAQHQVELRPLGAAEFALLHAIGAGRALEEALAADGAADRFDAGEVLRRFVAAGVVVDFHIAGAGPALEASPSNGPELSNGESE